MKYRMIMFSVCVVGVSAVCEAEYDSEDVVDSKIVSAQIARPIPIQTGHSSVVKTSNSLTTRGGDAVVDGTRNVHYEITYQIGNGPLQTSRLQGDVTVKHIGEMENAAHIKGQSFTLHRVVKAAK